MVSSVSFQTVMFAFSRRLAYRRYLYRELSTTTEFSSTTQSASIPRPLPLANAPALSNETLFVRPWDGIPSIAHALAIVRGIESRYGKVRAFKFGRDIDLIDHYVPYFWAELETPSNFTGEDVFQVPAPNIDLRKKGGVGLEDLQGLLGPNGAAVDQLNWQSVTEQMMNEVDSGVKQKFIEVRVQRADSQIPIRERRFKSPSMNERAVIANALSQWGGFSRPRKGSTAVNPNPDSQSHYQDLPRNLKMDRRGEKNLPDLTEKSLSPEVSEEEPNKLPSSSSFDYEYNNTANSTPAKSSNLESGQGSTPPRSIKEKQKLGLPLSRRERTILQAASLVRKPLTHRMRESLASSGPDDIKPPSYRKRESLTSSGSVYVPKPPSNRQRESLASFGSVDVHPPHGKSESLASSGPADVRPTATTPTITTRDEEGKTEENQSPPENPKQEKLEKKPFQDRLWKLVGGKWF